MNLVKFSCVVHLDKKQTFRAALVFLNQIIADENNFVRIRIGWVTSQSSRSVQKLKGIRSVSATATPT